MAVRGLGLFLVSTGLAFNGFLGNLETYSRPPARPNFFVQQPENLNSASPQQVLNSYIFNEFWGSPCFFFFFLILICR